MGFRSDLLARPDLSESRAYLVQCCAASRTWDSLLRLNLSQYGDHGPAVSGCGRAHFPSAVKDNMRAVARLVSEYRRKAESARPARVRHSTINALACAVATRDGSGFYGPQPKRES